MSKEKGFLKDVLTHMTAILAVTAIGSIATYFGVVAASMRLDFLKPYTIHVTIFIVSLAVLLIIVLLKKFNRYNPSFPRVDCDFHVIKKQISINFISPKKIIYSKHFELRALRDNLTRYEDKYRWSGKTPPVSLESGLKQHTVIQTGTRNLWNLYEVKFNRSHKKNDVIHVEAVWKMEDPEMTHVPFISTTIEEPTDDLSLRVQFNKSFGVSEVVCDHRHCIQSGATISSETHEIDNGEYSWDIKNPKLLHHYEIRWIPKIKTR
jgi:hypothetical protein